MNVLDVPLVAIGVVLTVLVFAFGVRRLLGLRLAPLRTLAAGLIAFFVAQPIIRAIGGPAVRRGAPTLPGLWFVLLGLVIALLVLRSRRARGRPAAPDRTRTRGQHENRKPDRGAAGTGAAPDARAAATGFIHRRR